MKARGEIKIIAGAALFSFIPVGVQMAGNTGVFTLLTGRLVVAALILFFLRKNREALISIKFRQFFKLIIFSSIMAGAMISYFFAIRLCGMALSSALLGTQPVLIALLALILLKEKIKLKTTFSVLLALLGLFLISGIKTSDQYPNAWAGEILALLSAFLLSLNFIYQKKHLSEYEGNTLVFFQSLFQIPIILPFILADKTICIDLNFLQASLLLGLICTVAAYSLIYSGAREVSAQKIGVLQTIEYIMPALIGWIFYNESANAMMICGVISIVLSCILETTGTIKLKHKRLISQRR